MPARAVAQCSNDPVVPCYASDPALYACENGVVKQLRDLDLSVYTSTTMKRFGSVSLTLRTANYSYGAKEERMKAWRMWRNAPGSQNSALLRVNPCFPRKLRCATPEQDAQAGSHHEL